MAVSVFKNIPFILAINLCIALASCISYKKVTLTEKIQFQCLNQEKPETIDILMLRLGHWASGEDNKSLQKWVLCVLVRHGLMTKRGVFRLDQALARFPKDEHDLIIRRIDRCLYTKKNHPHEIAWNYLKCINRNNPLGLHLL